MEYNFFLLTTFLMRNINHKNHEHIHCLGSREILKPNKEIPKHVLGMIEFESSFIPVVDLEAASGIEPTKIDNSKCILIVEHNYKSKKLYTGIVIQDSEEIMKLAAGFFELWTGPAASINVHLVLDMQNNRGGVYEILVESHKILSLLEETATEMPQEYSSLQPASLYNFINELGAMNFPQRHVLLDRLANDPELWDKGSNVMYL